MKLFPKTFGSILFPKRPHLYPRIGRRRSVDIQEVTRTGPRQNSPLGAIGGDGAGELLGQNRFRPSDFLPVFQTPSEIPVEEPGGGVDEGTVDDIRFQGLHGTRRISRGRLGTSNDLQRRFFYYEFAGRFGNPGRLSKRRFMVPHRQGNLRGTQPISVPISRRKTRRLDVVAPCRLEVSDHLLQGRNTSPDQSLVGFRCTVFELVEESNGLDGVLRKRRGVEKGIDVAGISGMGNEPGAVEGRCAGYIPLFLKKVGLIPFVGNDGR